MAPALSSSTLTAPIFSEGEADDGEAYDGEADVQQCLPTPALAVADPFGEADGYYDGVYHLLAPSSHIVAFAAPATNAGLVPAMQSSCQRDLCHGLPFI